ncbi:MAG: T9SS type A sorting domain-containing protein [Flavobacteriaceae bacterium]|nr:T9SS type A sorting domain-containing protein [Flavobacteriaceae bacterium]
MKKITYLLIAIFTVAFSFSAKAQCDYTIELTDSWGDGWNGISNMDVLVNGAVVLDDIGVSPGAGTLESFTFTVSPGDDITTAFNPAATASGPDWASECSYRILDALGTEVANQAAGSSTVHNGPADITTGTIAVTCPSCDVPVFNTNVVSNCPTDTQFNIEVNVTDIGAAASVTISDNQGSTPQQLTAAQIPGTVTFGLYANATSVTITVTNDDDGTCAADSLPLTYDAPACPPANDDCGTAQTIVQETNISDASLATPTPGTIEGATDSGLAAEACNGFTGNANDDVWYAFEALTSDVNITFECVDFDAVVQLYSGTCGALTVVACADDTVTTAPIVEEIIATGLTVGATYYVRIYQYGSGSTAGDSHDVKIWTSSLLSEPSLENESALKYYPNPVTSNLSLQAQKTIDNVSVYNMLGQRVMDLRPDTTDLQVDMSTLSQGSYFVKLSIDGVIETIRIIKK